VEIIFFPKMARKTNPVWDVLGYVGIILGIIGIILVILKILGFL
tara:strand:- start:34 stop:165 length:132 start_codon:yes stop_codon:yes gene_type:complete